MDRLHSQLDTDSASIAVSRDMLSTIELFECVGDLNIDIEIRNDSILSADDARLIYLWYNYNYCCPVKLRRTQNICPKSLKTRLRTFFFKK